MRNIILTMVAVLISLTAFAQTYYTSGYINSEGITDETVVFHYGEIEIVEGNFVIYSPIFESGWFSLDNVVSTEGDGEWIGEGFSEAEVEGKTTTIIFFDRNDTDAVTLQFGFDSVEYSFNLFKNDKFITVADFEKDLKL